MDTKTKTVDEYIEKHSNYESELKLLREIALEAGLEETIKWGAPCYMVDGKNLMGIAAFKAYVGIWFYQGALLADKDGHLINAQEDKTKALRQWRFSTADDIPKDKVSAYILEAIDNHKQGKAIKPQKSALVMPELLAECLHEDEILKHAFDKLTPYKQKEYAEHINSAKREATKLSRLEKIKPMILAGVGLNDKYKNC